MPLYHFICETCAHDFEELVFNGDSVECPECHGTQLERQLPVVGMPQVKDGFPSACGDPSLPPCGAPGCRRTGRA